MGILFVVWNNSYSKTLSKLQLSLPALSESYILSEHALSNCFRDNFDGMLTVQDFADPFLYLNGVGLLFHLFFGIMGRNRKSIPPLLTLDHRYIWFPILIYITFFLVTSLIILISKHIEKKRGEENNEENTFK